MTLFDYRSLDAETRIVVQQKTSEIRTLMRRAAQDIVDIGLRLIEVKARLPHGQFLPWLEAEFSDWSERTAQNFMLVGQRFKSANFADLEIAPSALYLLSAPSTPEAARVEAIDRAAGEPITHQDDVRGGYAHLSLSPFLIKTQLGWPSGYSHHLLSLHRHCRGPGHYLRQVRSAHAHLLRCLSRGHPHVDALFLEPDLPWWLHCHPADVISLTVDRYSPPVNNFF